MTEISQRTRYAVFDDEQFKADIQDYRIRQGLTQNQLALAAGVNLNTINMWIRNRTHYLNLPTAAALAAYCDLSLDSYIRIVNLEPEPIKIKWGT